MIMNINNNNNSDNENETQFCKLSYIEISLKGCSNENEIGI